MFANDPYAALLDSALLTAERGRYAFIAAEPFRVLRDRVVEAPQIELSATQIRRRVADIRAEGEAPLEEDLDVPAFLRRQAD